MAQAQQVVDDGGTQSTAGTFNRIPTDVDAGESVVTSQDGEQETHVEVSPAEQKAESDARTHGWVSRDEWEADGKDPSRWRPASEFMDVRQNILSVVKGELAKERIKTANLETKLLQREKMES